MCAEREGSWDTSRVIEEPGLSDVASRNRTVWDEHAAEYQATHGSRLRRQAARRGAFGASPESELGILGDVGGREVLELGCGAAQWSIALHQEGADVTALDNSGRQLQYARTLMASAGVEFPLVHTSAESTGLADASFDIVFCDHGAMTFAESVLDGPRSSAATQNRGVPRAQCTRPFSLLRGGLVATIQPTGCSSTTGSYTPWRSPTTLSPFSCPMGRGSASFVTTDSSLKI